MAINPGAEKVYEVGKLFRERCFDERRSFLWPNEVIWTEDNLETLLGITEPAGSFEVLIDALKPEHVLIQMLAVDVLAAGSLYPAVRRATQEQDFRFFL